MLRPIVVVLQSSVLVVYRRSDACSARRRCHSPSNIHNDASASNPALPLGLFVQSCCPSISCHTRKVFEGLPEGFSEDQDTVVRYMKLLPPVFSDEDRRAEAAAVCISSTFHSSCRCFSLLLSHYILVCRLSCPRATHSQGRIGSPCETAILTDRIYGFG